MDFYIYLSDFHNSYLLVRKMLLVFSLFCQLNCRSSLFMFVVSDKSRLIRDIRQREEILAEQELWSDTTTSNS